MKIIDFDKSHIEMAVKIAKQNYDDERKRVPVLPPVDKTLDLLPFAENGYGVAAIDGDVLLGFLCCYEPFDNAFSIKGLRGVFSPMGANGTLKKNNAAIYARLYEVAGKKWAQSGATSHAINLYVHDTEAQAQFFRYAFGIRTVDAIRGVDEINMPANEGYSFHEIELEDALNVLTLRNMLNRSYLESPFFMYRKEVSETDFISYFKNSKPSCFTVQYRGQNVAFITAEHDGETFIRDVPGYYHITGMYCLPEHRGKGIGQMLLNQLVLNLKTKGYSLLGTDFESINPSGAGFWQKYFCEYAYGVVRRIDGSRV
jgi:ribosomal protein S18 acetylase RimI-like enzyme